mgnify:CR=1 FL=1
MLNKVRLMPAHLQSKVINTAWYKLVPIACAILWLLYANATQDSLSDLMQSALSSALGVVGAIFANLSGAGGGVVFIPVFAQLGFSEAQSVSTSFAIQCFGMTAGAVTWSMHYRHHHRDNPHWQSFIQVVGVTSALSIAGIWTAQHGEIGAPSSLAHSFAIFSVILGLSLLAQLYVFKAKIDHHNRLKAGDYIALIAIGFGGGLITAWLSVGVGELLVLYLIFRGFNTAMAIASAVVVTAITVWSASPIHLGQDSFAVWDVAMYAGPAAIIGGVLAKTLSQMISTKALKTILGCWILMMGLVG